MASTIDDDGGGGGDDYQGQGGAGGQEQCVPLEPYTAPAYQAADQQGYEYPPRCVCRWCKFRGRGGLGVVM